MKDIVALLLEINKRQKGYYVGKLFYRRKLFNIQVIKRTTQKVLIAKLTNNLNGRTLFIFPIKYI